MNRWHFSAGDQNQALPLSTLTGSGKHPAAARLNPVIPGSAVHHCLADHRPSRRCNGTAGSNYERWKD
ncbi:Uncharacterised protein [Escherichia coli]|nr:Uncharacterised protein [Escherichia coli]